MPYAYWLAFAQAFGMDEKRAVVWAWQAKCGVDGLSFSQ